MITNGYLTTEKYNQIHGMYISAADTLNIELIPITNREALVEISNAVLLGQETLSTPEFILFLDKDIILARHLENMGYRVFNSSHAIEVCDDKALTFLELAGSGIKMPRTVNAPLCFHKNEETALFYQTIENVLGYPMIIKERFGSFGEQVYLANNRDELIRTRDSISPRPHVYQELIKSSVGRDVRLQVVGEKVVAAMKRHSDTDFRANLSMGGKMEPFLPGDDFIAMALTAAKTAEVLFCGVDILFGAKGEPILCEINSNAHIKNIFDCTHVDVAQAILHSILEVIR